jgi:hypothetical protein
MRHMPVGLAGSTEHDIVARLITDQVGSITCQRAGCTEAGDAGQSSTWVHKSCMHVLCTDDASHTSQYSMMPSANQRSGSHAHRAVNDGFLLTAGYQ